MRRNVDCKRNSETGGGVGGGSSLPTLLKHKYQLKIVHCIRQINALILKQSFPFKISSRLTNLVIFQGIYKKEYELRRKRERG